MIFRDLFLGEAFNFFRKTKIRSERELYTDYRVQKGD